MQHFIKIDSLIQRYGAWLFYIGLILFLLDLRWFWINDIPKAFSIFHYYAQIAAPIFFWSRIILLAKRYPKYVLLCLIILPILFLSAKHSQSKLEYYFFLAIAASRDSDFRITLRIYFTGLLFLLAFGPLSNYLGWTNDLCKHKFDLVGHSWGFTNPNRLGALLALLSFLFIYITKQKEIKFIFFTCTVVATIVFFITLSITSCLLLLLFPILYYLNDRFQIHWAWLATLPFFAFLLSVCFSLYYGPSLGETTFESRFSIPYLVYEQNGISWLGHVYRDYATWADSFRSGKKPFYINNMYLAILLRNGIITWTIFMGFFTYLVYRIARHNCPTLKAVAICMIILGIFQCYPAEIRFNFLVLSFFYLENFTKQPMPIIEKS